MIQRQEQTCYYFKKAPVILKQTRVKNNFVL